MRISHRNKFIFLSNPRCGSTSIRQLLDPYSCIKSGKEFPYNNHTNARRLKAHFQTMGWNWEDYTVITTIRNPFDRVASMYSFGLSNQKSTWHRLISRHPTIDAFVSALPDYFKNGLPPERDGGFTIDIFAFSETGERLVEHIIPIKSIDSHLPPILKKLNISCNVIPHVNMTSGKHSFNENSMITIAELFASDISLGNYA